MALKELLTHLIMGDPVPRSQASKAEPPPPPDVVNTNQQQQHATNNSSSSNKNSAKLAQPMHHHHTSHAHSRGDNHHEKHSNQTHTKRAQRHAAPATVEHWQLECKYTLSEVQQHCSLDDCWVVIFDKVYNITEFVFEHPGGDFILLEYAGRDATHPFLSSRHGSSAYKMLDKYWIGILVDEELYYSNNSSYCSVYSNLSWRTTPPTLETTTTTSNNNNNSDSSSTITTASSVSASSVTSSSSSSSSSSTTSSSSLASTTTTTSSSTSTSTTESSAISAEAERQDRERAQLGPLDQHQDQLNQQLVRYVQRPLFCFDTT